MSDEARLLAEIHAARALMRAIPPMRATSPLRATPPLRAEASASRPGHAALWAHATRAPDRPVDLAVARAIRTDPDTARRYRTLLGAQAVAHTALAVAASDGGLSRRRVGPFELEILEAEDDAPPLLILRGASERPPRVIEVLLGAETARLALGPPVAGAILLALDPALPEAALLGRLLRDPDCAVFLL